MVRDTVAPSLLTWSGGLFRVRGISLMVKGNEFDGTVCPGTPLPLGLLTVTKTWPSTITSAAGIVTVTAVPVTLLGVRVVPPKVTVAPDWKPVPVMVSGKAGDCSLTLFGIRVVVDNKAPTVKGAAAEARPSGVTTVTLTRPSLTRSAAGTTTVTWVGVTVAGVRGVVPKDTVAPGWKPVPVMVSVKEADPGAAALGLRLAITG